MSFYTKYPTSSVPTYASFTDLPASATDGSLAVTLDTDVLYVFNAGTQTWIAIGSPGAALALGNLDSQAATAKGAALVASVLSMQSADATHPGLVNNAAQTFSGAKTFTSNINALGTSAVISAGVFPLTGGQTFVALENSSLPGVFFYAGGSDAYSIIAGAIAGLSFRNTGAGTTLLGLTDTDATFRNAGVAYATLSSSLATFTGTLSAANFSGSSSGTNTGDVTIGTANGLSIAGQVLSLGLSSTSTTGALSSTDWNTFNNKQSALTFVAPLVNTAGSVAINGNIQTNKLSFVDFTDATKKLTFDLSTMTTGVTALLQLQTTQNTTYSIRPNVDATANIITQNGTTGQIFIGADASIGGANSGIQYSNAVAANRGQIRLGSYINATSVAGVTTATSRSGTVGVNAAVVAGQDYSKWTAQAGATTAGSLPISGAFAFKANTVNSLTVTSDYHIQLTNLAGTLADRLYLSSEGLLQLPGYTAGVAQFDASGNISSAAISPGSLSLTNTHIFVGNASNVAADVAMSGDATIANTGALTLATVNGNVGSFTLSNITVNAKGLITAASSTATGNLTDAGTDGIVITGGTGAVIGAGTSIAQQVSDATHNGYLSSTDWSTFNGKQAAGNYITALTGDVTATGPGSVAATLATVNGNVGSFGSSTSIPNFTVNAKGLITAAGSNVVIAPAGTLTGTTLAANVVSSSLTSVGTITTGVWNGTTIGPTFGGTGVATYTTGDTLYASASNVLSKLPIGSTGNVLTVTGGVPVWAAPATGGTVTSVALADGSSTPIYTITGSPVTSSGTLTFSLSNQTANTVFAGPGTGSPAQPTFRSLVVADIPALPYASSTLTNTHIFVGNASNVATDVALSGDATLANTGALTLATVNGNVGSFGSSTSIPSFTVNAKGLITAASGNVVIAPAGTLTGTTLAANVVTSSLTSVGTITTGTWNGTTIAIANGGTGQTTKAAAFDALSPMTTGGDLIYGGASGTGTRLANGTAGQLLQSNGTTLAPSWVTSTAGDMTLAGVQTVTGAKTFGTIGGAVGKFILAGSTSGSSIVNAAAVAGSTTFTLPGVSGTIALNPMTTGGDLIYGGTAGVETRLANGTAGQHLTSSGTTLAPTWTNVPGFYYASVYYAASTSNYWSLASATITDFTTTGTISTPTVYTNPNFGTISKATSDLPGINFSAPRTGVIEITCVVALQPSNNATSAGWSLNLIESTTTTGIAATSGAWFGGGGVALQQTCVLTGFFAATAATTYNFKLRGFASSGTMFIGSQVAAENQLSFTVKYIT